MRERLIELLRDTFNYTKGVCIDFDEAVEINADHLLANGVVVPPCKVGDNLYYIPFGSTITKWEIRSIEIMQDDIVFHCGRTFFLKFDIGKTVFLTREEAEAKLKEGVK